MANNNCENLACFTIYTLRFGGGLGGPDPYSDETHSCEQHVGKLMGWQPEAKDTSEIYWEVRQGVPEGAFCCFALGDE